MGNLKKLAFITCLSLASTYSYAEPKVVEFSAEAVISMPQHPDRHMKLYVGKKAVRREIEVDGKAFVEIVYPEEGRSLHIDTGLKSYSEKLFPVEVGKKKDTPCDQIISSVCEKLGEETVDGHKTEKWQIISNNNGRKLRTLHWIDIKRKLALREFFPDGSVAELKMLKKVKINGRNTEKWQRTMSRPNGDNVRSFQWYDTGLKIAIKEELPGGYIRELKNIKVSRQDNSLFTAPSGYKKIVDQPASYQQRMSR